MSATVKAAWLVRWGAAIVIVASATPCAWAQFGFMAPGTQFELSDSVQLDRADNAVLQNLERAKALLADKQWSDAVETLRQVMESSPGMLLGVTERRFVSVRDYCQLRFAGLPREALEIYRSRTDPLARKWYEEGVRRLDRQLLLNVADQALASSWGDDALWAVGELSLIAGDAATARWYWSRLLPVEPGAAATWPAHPDSDKDPAAVRARLVLASILEGSTARARDELAQLARLHPEAKGSLGGRDVKYVQALRELLDESAGWPQPAPDVNWPTFAGSAERSKLQPAGIDAGGVAWRMSLPVAPLARKTRYPGPGARVADDAKQPLAYHPAVVDGMVFVGHSAMVLGVRLDTGKPLWEGAGITLYRDELDRDAAGSLEPLDTLGTPRFTLTVDRGQLFARLGPAVTARPQLQTAHVRPSTLVCLDLAAQGRLVWKLTAEEGWAYEGPPLADASSVYIALRRSDVRDQAHVACFDRQTGQQRWRRFVCAAETPGRSMFYQCTHNLLTMAGDSIYFNTNLGAVAALAARDGQIRWASLYPRTRQGDLARLAPHWQRDLTPCIYHRGTLLVAPADSPRVFALDAATGQIVWESGSELEDVVHLLGVVDDTLVASGHRLYFIGLKEPGQGRVRRVWPDGPDKLGFGRGLIAGGAVYWPTRTKIFQIDARTGQPVKTIDLGPRGAAGGNLAISTAGQAGSATPRLLIATPGELIAIGDAPSPGRTPQPSQTAGSLAPRGALGNSQGREPLDAAGPAQSKPRKGRHPGGNDVSVAPTGLPEILGPVTQGCALGYCLAPLRGGNSHVIGPFAEASIPDSTTPASITSLQVLLP